MKPTKRPIYIGLLLGALLFAGLFLFLRRDRAVLVVSEMKPSQLNLSQSNHLPKMSPPPASTNTGTPATTEPGTQNALHPKAQALQGGDQKKWRTFEEILATKNDNDARLDQDLKNLSPAFREALVEKYDALPAENRNGKGLIGYMIARQASTADDFQALKKIYEEPPCLSLANCKSTSAGDPHYSSVEQTTLVYPQLATLYSFEKQLNENPALLNDAIFRGNLIPVLVQAENYQVPAVHDKAKAIRTRFGL